LPWEEKRKLGCLAAESGSSLKLYSTHCNIDYTHTTLLRGLYKHANLSQSFREVVVLCYHFVISFYSLYISALAVHCGDPAVLEMRGAVVSSYDMI